MPFIQRTPKYLKIVKLSVITIAIPSSDKVLFIKILKLYWIKNTCVVHDLILLIYFVEIQGQGKFDVNFLEPALQFCSHLIYGYAGINQANFRLSPLNEQFDVNKNNYRTITDLKKRYPGLRVLLSVGGGEDVSGEDSDKNLKYRTLVQFLDF